MKIGIIGTGNISYRHFEEFSKINGINIEAVCDVNEENLHKFISHFGGNIKSYSSAEEMLFEGQTKEVEEFLRAYIKAWESFDKTFVWEFIKKWDQHGGVDYDYQETDL